MKKKNEPIRTCLCCGKKDYKKSLVRLVSVNDNIVVDEKKVLPGRGAYLCYNSDCLTRLSKNKRFLHALRINKSIPLDGLFTVILEKIKNRSS